MYSGKSDNTPRTKNGLGYDWVMHLTKGLESSNHTIYFDRFFLSVNLLLDLHKIGIFACGTVMPMYRGKGAEKLSVQCPVVFAQYKRNMGSMDLANQRRKYFSVGRKSLKRWYIFSFLLDTAVNNDFILMKATNSQTKRIYQLYDFKLELIGKTWKGRMSQKGSF
ncbi:hypothetical protein HNY73_000758 [Argiope bruennichi]|uniref:PiggyBac transposable element-derived protein domain-containing protein n=1 Tax=Argiope bruennichi TaxID=94029 RepID=A0A8T0FZ42_ARGBR|nr:hypothetical protein HNY73_000758 [Argiope bruennichi]